jgi:hypothetical protein
MTSHQWALDSTTFDGSTYECERCGMIISGIGIPEQIWQTYLNHDPKFFKNSQIVIWL